MSPTEFKLYITLLCSANYQNGSIKTTMSDLGEIIGIHRSQISRAMAGLEKKGYATYQAAKNQFCLCEIRITKFVACDSACRKLSQATHKQRTSDMRKNKALKCEKKPRARARTKNLRIKELKNIKIMSVYDYYNQKIKKLRKLTPLRKQKIKSRLEDKFSVEELKKAIDNLANSDFHMGNNPDGKTYNELEWLFHSYERTEKWVNMKPKIPESSKRDPEFIRSDGLKNWEVWELQKMKNAKQIDGIWSENKWATEASDKAWQELEKLKKEIKCGWQKGEKNDNRTQGLENSAN